MNCDQFERRLNEMLDERADPEVDPRLAAHAELCDDCHARLAGSRVLLRGLARLSPAPLAPDFARRVVARATAEREAASEIHLRPRSRLWLACGVLLASAAAALLAISLVWYARRGSEGLAKGGVENAPAQRKVRQRLRGYATTLPGKSRQPANHLAIAGGDLLIEAPRLPGHLRNYRGAIDQLAITLPQTAEQFNQMEHFAPGIRPLRISLTVVWETLCRTLPGGRSEPAEVPQRTGQRPLYRVQFV